MAQVGNNQQQLGGEFMIQDRDHTSASQGAGQQEQSDSRSRRQGGGDQHSSGQQGGDHARKNR